MGSGTTPLPGKRRRGPPRPLTSRGLTPLAERNAATQALLSGPRRQRKRLTLFALHLIVRFGDQQPPPPNMQLLVRFLLGGLIVSLFALIGDVVRPKRFAGLFGAAPSVALATLALTAAKEGPRIASIEARSMVLTSVGFILYVYTVKRILASGRWPAGVVSMSALVIWGVTAIAAGMLLAQIAT